MKRFTFALATALICFASSTAMAASPPLHPKKPIPQPVPGKNYVAPTVEEQLAKLAQQVANQNAQIQQLQQQLNSQNQALESAENRIAAFEEAISVENGILTIDYPVVEISADIVSVNSGFFEVLGNLTVGGLVNSDTIVTKSVIAESYTPGAGNVW